MRSQKAKGGSGPAVALADTFLPFTLPHFHLPPSMSPAYERVLLKVSGETFCRRGESGIAMDQVGVLADQLKEVVATGCQVAVVTGGGNILRGKQFSEVSASHQPADRPLHGHAGDRHQRVGVAGRAGERRRATCGCKAPSRWRTSASRSSKAGASGTWKRAGW